FFFSSRRRHTRWPRDWSSDVCSSDLFLYQYSRTAGVSVLSPGKGNRSPHCARALPTFFVLRDDRHHSRACVSVVCASMCTYGAKALYPVRLLCIRSEPGTPSGGHARSSAVGVAAHP